MKLRFAFVLFLATLVAPPSGAQPSAGPGRRALALELLQVSGMDRCFANVADGMQTMLTQGRGQIHQDAFDAMAAAMAHVFTDEALRADGVAYLEATLDPDTARAVVEWLKTPLGRRMVGFESARPAEQARDEIRAFSQALDAEAPETRERLALVGRLLALTRATDLTVDTMVGLFRMMAQAGNAFVLADQRMTPAQMDDMAAMMKARMPGQMEAYLTALSLYMYRDASVQELADYVAFLDSPPGRWYCRMTSGTQLAAVDRAGKRLTGHLASRAH